jgi:peptidoglycan/LPS O-acetylase OafA/YrhL
MKIIFYIGLAISATSIANAATVVWSAYYDTGIIDAGPATSAPALATGNWVQIGYFSGLTDSQIQADALSVSGTAILAAAFQTFGQLQINTNNSYSNGLEYHNHN